jgi:hypothetical protein
MSAYAELSDQDLHRYTRRRLQERPADVLEWSALIAELRELAAAITERIERGRK